MIALIALMIAAGDLWPTRTEAASFPKHQTQTLSVTITVPPPTEQAPGAIEIVNGHILFKAKVFGREALLLLDNRASPSVIDTAFAEAAGQRVEKLEGTIRTVLGTVDKRIVRNVSIDVPGVVSIRADGLAAVDFEPFSQVVGRKIDGAVGNEVLAQFAVFVRASNRTFRFGKSGTVEVPSTIPLVPLLDTRPKLALKVGEATVTVTLDLGDNGMLSLTPEAWNRVAPKDVSLTRRGAIGVDGQPYRLETGILPAVTLGRFTRNNIRVRVIPGAAPEDGDGRIGAGFLADCDFLLDVKAGKLWLVPHPPSIQRTAH
jgi:hypothetical protein